MKKLLKNVVFDILAAVVFFALAVLILIPALDLGETLLDLSVAIVLLSYVIFYLIGKFSSSSSKMKICILTEIILISIVAVGLIFRQFNIINLSSTCAIFGLAVWLRGLFGAVETYLYRGTVKDSRYPLWLLLVYILVISAGVYMIAKPVISDSTLIYILAVAFVAIGAMFVFYAVKNSKKNNKKRK